MLQAGYGASKIGSRFLADFLSPYPSKRNVINIFSPFSGNRIFNIYLDGYWNKHFHRYALLKKGSLGLHRVLYSTPKNLLC